MFCGECGQKNELIGKFCIHCGAVIPAAEQANTTHHSGSTIGSKIGRPGAGPPVKRSAWGSGLRVLAGISVGVFFIYGVAKQAQSEAAAESAAKVAAEVAVMLPPTVNIWVDATELYYDYHRNEVDADTKYRGKSIRVSGIVASITKDFRDNVVVRLQGASRFSTVHATLRPASVPKISGSKPEEFLGATCKGAGMVLGSPILIDCWL